MINKNNAYTDVYASPSNDDIIDMLFAAEETEIEVSNYFQSDIEYIEAELKDLVCIWCGHSNFKWMTLTPECLSDLHTRSLGIRNHIRYFINDVYTKLGTFKSDQYGRTASDYEDLVYQNEFELELLQVINESFKLSSGESEEIDGIFDDIYLNSTWQTWQRNLLRPVKVVPWLAPPPPPLVVPERPRVVLQVLSVSDTSPRISVGFDDDFCCDAIGREILVDDDNVRVGDRVIIKTSGWKGFGFEMDRAEYDGLAEPNCPCSEIHEVMEAQYDFNFETEQDIFETEWNNAWLKQYFRIEPENVIFESGIRTLRLMQKSHKDEYDFDADDQANEYA